MAPAPTTKAAAAVSPEQDPKLNHLVQAQLSKTKMCGMFSRGSCNDAQCRFAHSSSELRRAPDLTKTAMCRAFATKGGCPRGAGCVFAHGEQELRVTPTVYKTQICNFHKRGFCKKGERCRHAHGEDQLRSFEPVAADTDVASALSAPSSPGAEIRSTARRLDRPRGHGRATRPANADRLADGPKSPKSPVQPQRPVAQELTLDAFEPMKVNVRGLGPQPQQPAFEAFVESAFASGGEGAQAFMAARAVEAAQAAQKHKDACDHASAAAARFAAAATITGNLGMWQGDMDFESILGSLGAPPMQVGGPSALQSFAATDYPAPHAAFPDYSGQWLQSASMSPTWVR